MAAEMVESLIPHRGRMKLIDEIVFVDEKRAVTASKVTEKWPMVKDHLVGSIVLVELVAQTAGVCLGFKERRKDDEVLDGTGWIVGIKKAVFYRSEIPMNSRIETSSEKVFEVELYSEIEGRANLGDEVLAEIKLQVVQSDSRGLGG